MTSIGKRQSKLPSVEKRAFCFELPQSHVNDFFRYLYALGQNYAWKGDYRNESSAIFREVLGNMACDCNVDCDQVADCIENNEGVREKITELVTSSETVEKIIERARADGLLPIAPTIPIVDCRDNVYSACVQYVEQLNQSIVDFFDVAETDKLEQLFEFVSALDLDISAPIGLISWLRDQAGDAYNASYTQVIADKIACDLFCLMKDDCAFTVQKAFDYHQGVVNEYLALSKWGDVKIAEFMLAYIGLDDAPATVWVNAMFAFFTGMLLLAETELSRVGSVTGSVSQLNKRVLSWMNDTNPDWAIFCTDCVPVLKLNIPAFGRGYRIGSGEFVIVNPVTDGQYVIPSAPIGGEVTLITNGSATAIGDCASGYGITVTVTYVDGYSARRIYGAGTCAEVGFDYQVGDTFTNVQVNGFGIGTTTFRIDA